MRLVNSLTHHNDRLIWGLRGSYTGGSAKGSQVCRGDELSRVNSLESIFVKVNFRLVRIRPLLKGSLRGWLISRTSRRSILHFGDQVSGVDVITHHGVVRRVEDSLDQSSEPSLCDRSWINFFNWSLNFLAIREDLINGCSNLQVGKIRVQDKWLVALLPGHVLISLGALFLKGVSKVHCSGTLSLLELERSRNRSNWCWSQCWDERWRRLSPTSRQNGYFLRLNAINIDDKSRWVRLSLGSHWWCLPCVCWFKVKIIYWPIYQPYKEKAIWN